MAKTSGLLSLLFVDGYDISGDVSALTRIGASSALLDVTAINRAAHERIYGRHDGEIAATVWFDDASAAVHEVLRAKGAGGSRVVTYCMGSAIGAAAAALVGKQITYDWTLGADGSLAGAVQFQSAEGYGLEYCEQLTAGKRTDASATNGASLDGGAATSRGLAAYLQVFSLGSGSPTVKLQESSDNGSSDPWADVTGGSFGVVSAPSAARIVTSLSQTVERYLRVVTTGTFSNLVFAVCVTREPVGA
jgi:hypothetical protein